MLKITTSTKEIVGEIRKIACSNCHTKTNHKVLAWIENFWNETEFEIQGVDNFEIISCLGCEQISFRKASTNSDDVDIDEEGNYEHTVTEEIYPNRLIGRPLLSDMYSLPEKIRNIYRETHSSLSARLNILAGVGIRGLIEAICLQEKAKGDNLKDKIDNLVIGGVLTQNSADILHKTRFLGNRSIHDIEAATGPELYVAFDILENLLETIYIIPKKALGLKK